MSAELETLMKAMMTVLKAQIAEIETLKTEKDQMFAAMSVLVDRINAIEEQIDEQKSEEYSGYLFFKEHPHAFDKAQPVETEPA